MALRDGYAYRACEQVARAALEHLPPDDTEVCRVAAANRQPVLYVTERCVFELTEHGLRLIEIAPGMDLEKDILAHMGFRPDVALPLKTMDARIFDPAPMTLRPDIVNRPQ